MNALSFFVSVFFFLTATICAFKIFGRTGLYVFVVFATILANIQVTKGILLFGFETTCGNVLYASSFLCTDILSERYGKKSAQKAVKIGIFVNIIWIIGTQLTLLSKPSPADTMQPHLEYLFGLMPRVAGGSLIAYICSQSIDVVLYHFLWKKSGASKKFLWLRNNGSTMISQAVDTTIFVTIAFLGTVPMEIFWSILFTTYLFKVVVALCDTPFMYLARIIQPFNKGKEDLEELIVY